MIAFRNTVIAVVAISLITFIALFGRLPALRKTPIGFIYRLLCIYTPNGFRKFDNNFTGGHLNRSIARLTDYLLYQKNPVILLLFLLLLTGSAFTFLSTALPLLSTAQKIPIPFLLGAPYFFTYLCVYTKADYITPDNHQNAIRNYPFDHILYRPGHICRTCGVEKPARSKHCSLCGVCVAKCDHHCPWVNNCLGRNNYRWFLLLLFSLGVVISYGAYLCWSILSKHLHFTPALSFISKQFWVEFGEAFVFAMNIGGLSIAGVGLLAITTAPLPFGLLGYHLYLVWAGMTTNESAKWADWRDDMYDGYVWKGKRSAVEEHNRQREARRLRSGNRMNGIPAGRPEVLDDQDQEIFVPWPNIRDQTVVRTTDGRAPVGQEQLWERCTGLDMVDNIYDIGFWRNLVDIMKGT